MSVIQFLISILSCCLAFIRLTGATDLPILHPGCDEFENASNPTQLPHPNDCGKFYKCSSGYAFTLSCPRGLHFNVKSNTCDFPAEAQCKISNGVTPTPSATVKGPSTSDNLIIVSCPVEENPKFPTHLPYPNDCTRFFKCKVGEAFPLKCPMGLHWSVELNRCDWPHVAKCVKLSTTSTTSAPTTSTTAMSLDPSSNILDAACSDVMFAFKPYPGNCSRFIRCVYGRGIINFCPGSLYFNSKIGICTSTCAWRRKES